MRDGNIKIKDVLSAFEAHDEEATVMEFTMEGWSIPSGGHLQGIQRTYTRRPCFIISGSSDHEAYFIVVGKTVDGYEIIQKKTISYDPYRHAGGIQIIGDYLVVGVEDNSKKNKSRVCFFHIRNPEKPMGDPIITIPREGEEKLATAGAVAIVKRPADHLLMVGSWDSDTLDFYKSNGIALGKPGCEFTFWQTWNKDDACRDDWSDHAWGNYQNLNLISDRNDCLFLIGYYCDEKQGDYADLYSLDLSNPVPEMIRKESRKHLKCIRGASFQYGGGIYINNERSLISYACERNCHEKTVINEFPCKNTKKESE